jgi:hypothetical protein
VFGLTVTVCWTLPPDAVTFPELFPEWVLLEMAKSDVSPQPALPLSNPGLVMVTALICRSRIQGW